MARRTPTRSRDDLVEDGASGQDPALTVEGEPIAVAEVMAESVLVQRGGPLAAISALSDAVGTVGLIPLFILLGLTAVERFDALAFGVLGPEIRDHFHLSNGSFDAIAALTSALPILLAVPLGYMADRVNRVRLCQIAGLVWGGTAILTGLAPVIAILVLARLLGGVGLLVNEPVHPSLLSDWYPPQTLPRILGVHRLGAQLGLLGGPLAGFLGEAIGWRATFVILAVPTFVLVVLMLRLQEPERGQSMGVTLATDQNLTIGESYRRVRAIHSLRRTWVAAFLFGSGTLSFGVFLNQFFDEEFHFTQSQRGLVTFVFGAGSAIGLLIGIRLTERLTASRGPSMLPIINGAMVVEFALGAVLMAVTPWAPLAIVFAFVLSVGSAGFLPPYLTMVALVAPPRLRSQAYAWSLLYYAMGALFIFPRAGAIADDHGFRPALLFLAAFVFAGGCVEISVRRFVDRDIAQATKAEATSHSTALLALSGVDVAYDQVQVLFDVDLEVHEGEILALLGTNGAGKSTLLKAISGVVDPIGGAIFFDGRDISHADAAQTAKLGISQVPGGRGVFPSLSVGENLRVAAWLCRKDKEYVNEALDRVLEYFPVLRTRWDTAAGSLSGGEQQMLSLGQAFLARPKLLLIDELSLGLAPTVVERLLEIVRAIHANGTTIILVEQSVNTALRLAERAIFMEKGEVRFSGATSELLKRTDILRAVFLKGAAAAAEARELGEANGSNGRKANGRATAAQAKKAAREDTARREALLAAEVVLETSGLTKRYGGVSAVNDVDLQLHDGQILGLIGPNGAGKTTIFDLICGFTPINGGRVRFRGEDVTDVPANLRAARGLGRSFQDARLWTSLTVREAIAVGLERFIEVKGTFAQLAGIPAVTMSELDTDRRVEEVIEVMGLGAFRDKFISELSTGSRRMVEIATLIGHRPSVLLLDEPSSGIAQKETEALGPLLREVQKHLNCSMLVIEHDMPLITGLADHLVALDAGSVVTLGVPSEVLNHPRVVEAYLGAAATDESSILED